MPRLLFGPIIAFVCLIGLSSCAQTNKPVSIESQLASGGPIYAQTCATSTCHAANGEGIWSGDGFKVWPLVGPEFQSRHPNAEIVFDVIRSGDEPNLRALTDQQVYDSIAYELSQNQIHLESPLVAENAFATYGGTMSGKAQGDLYPPSNNTVISNLPPTHDLPIHAENDSLRLQLDQIAETNAIGNTKPPAGGVYLILVIVFNDLKNESITVSPDHLRLSTPGGELLQPQPINIQSAIEKFHTQTIKPNHGTAALVVFTLSTPEDFDQLIYDDGNGNQLTLALKP